MDPTSNNNANGFAERLIPPLQTNPSADAVAPPKINKERLRYVVLDSLDAQKSRQEIREKLMAYGQTEIEADRFIEEIEREQRRTREYDEEHRGDARFLRVYGGITFLSGLVVLIGCVIAASYDRELLQNPVLFAGIFMAATAKFIGVRMFWRGT